MDRCSLGPGIGIGTSAEIFSTLDPAGVSWSTRNRNVPIGVGRRASGPRQLFGGLHVEAENRSGRGPDSNGRERYPAVEARHPVTAKPFHPSGFLAQKYQRAAEAAPFGDPASPGTAAGWRQAQTSRSNAAFLEETVRFVVRLG
jgi:hypothetical protein